MESSGVRKNNNFLHGNCKSSALLAILVRCSSFISGIAFVMILVPSPKALYTYVMYRKRFVCVFHSSFGPVPLSLSPSVFLVGTLSYLESVDNLKRLHCNPFAGYILNCDQPCNANPKARELNFFGRRER